MNRENLKARLCRAISGKTQEQMGEEIDVHPTLITQIELGKVLPKPHQIAGLARGAGLTVADAEEILCLAETLQRSPRRQGRTAEDLFADLAERLRSHTRATYRRLLTLPLPDRPPRAEDRQRAAELFKRLEDLSPEARLAVVRVAEEYQSWALCELVCHTSQREASRDVEGAAAWARLGQEIAERVRGPEGWRKRVQGFAAAHVANALGAAGKLQAAADLFTEAWRLWHAGSDPDALLDPERLLDLEASLCS
jgi:transcriptional regulator with XRE-family HTH domain